MPDFTQLGSSLKRMTELHIIEARRHALDLFTMAGAIYPDEWRSNISERVAISAFDFASHAYRVNELCDFGKNQFLGASNCKYQDVGSPEKIEDNYIFAIHKIRHARDLTVGWTKLNNSKLFLKSNGDLAATYLMLKGNNHPGSISLFGVSLVYLTQVIISIKSDYTILRF